MNRWEMEKKIAIRALKDPNFKKKLLSNPKEALKEFFKGEKERLDMMHVKVYEEKKNEWIFSIPYLEEGHRELSEKELEKLVAANLGCVCETSL